MNLRESFPCIISIPGACVASDAPRTVSAQRVGITVACHVLRD